MRNLRESDHGKIIPIVDGWWGRPVSKKLPRLFFRHFEDTSFVVEESGEVVAFLVGFVSQSRADEAYIHFAGVHPASRGHGLARKLYETFFEMVRKRGCDTVRCISSPANEGSIAFHRTMGFEVEVRSDYDDEGEAKVVFAIEL